MKLERHSPDRPEARGPRQRGSAGRREVLGPTARERERRPRAKSERCECNKGARSIANGLKTLGYECAEQEVNSLDGSPTVADYIAGGCVPLQLFEPLVAATPRRRRRDGLR